jgi:hypothetical protein
VEYPIDAMDEQLLKQLISQMNKKTFSKFVFELWGLLNYDVEPDFVKLRPLKNNKDVFEQHFRRQIDDDDNFWHGYSLILPFFFPLELFVNTEDFNFCDQDFVHILKSYKKTMDNRISKWFFPVDGNFVEPNISFVTNFEGYQSDIYFDFVIPGFQKILDKIGLEAIAEVGSCDSFFMQNSEDIICAFKNFLSNYKGELSITFKDGKADIRNFIPDKYISGGY